MNVIDSSRVAKMLAFGKTDSNMSVGGGEGKLVVASFGRGTLRK